ncbi:uncharacterized protein LOC134245729 [Saccostrea cucullata]|uniref:uncharacterized protein LOC134245729 n=1 Tax=Saccostrea cuccullata TaxID=36930 RepID=UPI002ED39380
MDVKFSPVTACPKDGLTWLSNSFKLQCPNDTLGRSLYQCVPNDDRSSLVEFCLRGSIGRYEAETCPFAVSSGHLDAINCSSFLKGCLKEPYLTNEVYKYPTCLEINPQKSYYLADGICINKKSHEIPKSTTFIQPTASSAYTLSTDSFNLTWVLPNSTSDSQPGIDTVPIITGVVSSLIVLVVIFVIFLFLYSKKCRSCSTIKSTEKDISLIQKQHKPKEEVETCNIDNELVPIRPARKQETSVKIEHESMKSEHGAGKYNFYCEPEMSERTAIEESTNLELLFDFVSRQLSFTDLPFVSTYIGEPQLAETAYIDGNPSETYCKVFHMWRCKYPRIDHKAKLKEIFSSMERQDLIENIDMFSKDSFYYKESLFNPKEQAQSSDFILMSQNLAMKSNHVLRFLGLKQCDIDQIERDNRTTQEKILRALSRVQEDRLSLTRQSICNALYYADHSDVIDILNSSWNRAARKIAKKGNRKKRIPEKNSFKDGTRNNTTWTEGTDKMFIKDD